MPLGPNQFPTTKDLTRIREEQNFHLLYKCEVYDEDERKGVFRLKQFFAGDSEKKDLLAIALNLPNLIVDAGVDFLFGEDIKVKIEDAKWQKWADDFIERNEFNLTLEESAVSLQNQGHANFSVRAVGTANNRQAIVEEVPFDMWFPDWSGVPVAMRNTGTVHLASYITVKKENETDARYIYVQEHTAGFIRHTLWTEFEKRAQTQVPLNTVPGLMASLGMPETNDLEVSDPTGIVELPVFQINTRKTVKDRNGQSLIKPILPLIEEVNDRLTQVSLQFLKHLDPLLQIPKSAVKLNKDGTVNRAALEVLLTDADMPDAKYVTNSNPLIEEAFKHIDKMIEKCADLTKTPRSFLMPDDKGGVESVEALRTRLMGFLKRIKRYQKAYKGMIIRTLKIAAMMEGTPFPDNLKIIVEFDEGIPRDKTVEVGYYSAAHDGGLMSLETAVAALQGLEGDALKEEMKRILADMERIPKFDMSGNRNPKPPKEDVDEEGDDDDDADADAQ